MTKIDPRQIDSTEGSEGQILRKTAGTTSWGIEHNVSDAAHVFNVGQDSWMYESIQEAIDAMLELFTPDGINRGLIKIWPGKYFMDEPIVVPEWVGVQGAMKGITQLQNDTTDMFVCSGHNYFSDFLVEGSPTSTLYAFDGNGANGIHIRNVDMLNNGGDARQKFLKQSGSTWRVLTVERCVIDYYATSGYAVTLTNTHTAARFCDTWIESCFFDAFQLTTFGGSFELFGVQDVRFWNSTIRGNNDGSPDKFHTGIRHNYGSISSGTPRIEVAHCRMSGPEAGSGGVAIYGEANTDYIVDNSLVRGATKDPAGTSTIRNSTTTA